MRQIIYASSAVDEMTPEKLDIISQQAKRNNSINNLTGILIYGDQMFFQVLEGPPEKITEMKDLIWSDERHNGISEFKDSLIHERSFPDWSMGCYRLKTTVTNDSQWPIVDLNSITDHLPPTTTPDVRVLVETFFQIISPRNLRHEKQSG